MKPFLTSLLLFTIFSMSAQNRERAFEINSRLGRGINFGNMFEAPSESEWGNPWQPEYARMVAELGFNHVRVPIRWEPEARSSASPPYTVHPDFLARIKQVVDSCLNSGLLVIINMHHHDMLFENPDGQKARFLAQWKQISEFFKDYPDELLFEILNEPHSNLTAEKWNTFLAAALSTIREDNPDRVVLIGTAESGGLNGLSKLSLPEDQNIILTVHYYNPFQFTHQGAEWVDNSNPWLGTKWEDTETERAIVQSDFAPLKALEEKQHIPVHIGEFGAYSKADESSRGKWTTYLSRYFETLGWSWAYWEFSAGFGIYNPSTHVYLQYLADALLNNPMPEPGYYTGTPLYHSNFSTGSSEWTLHTQEGASGSKQNIDDQLKVQINAAGTEGWHIQLVKNNVQLEAGKRYRVTFVAKADANRTITSYAGQSVSPWSAYSGYNGITLSDTLSEYSYIFDMYSTDHAARLVFDFGTSAVDVYFASISLESIELQEPTSSKILNEVKSRLFPNPVTNYLFADNLDAFETLRIQNLNGQVVLEKTVQPFQNQIDLSHLSSGIYFVSLINKTEKFSTKIIKN